MRHGRNSKYICFIIVISIAVVYMSGQIFLVSAQSDINRRNIEILISEKKPYPPGFYTDEYDVKMDVVIKNNLPTPANLSVYAQTNLLTPIPLNMSPTFLGDVLVQGDSVLPPLNYIRKLPEGQWSVSIIARNRTDNAEYKEMHPFVVHPVYFGYQFWVYVASILGAAGIIIAGLALLIQYKNLALTKRQRRPWIGTEQDMTLDQDRNVIKFVCKNYGNEPTNSLEMISLIEGRVNPIKEADFIKNGDFRRLSNLAPDQTRLWQVPVNILDITNMEYYGPALYYGFYIRYGWHNSKIYGKLVVVYKQEEAIFSSESEDLI